MNHGELRRDSPASRVCDEVVEELGKVSAVSVAGWSLVCFGCHSRTAQDDVSRRYEQVTSTRG